MTEPRVIDLTGLAELLALLRDEGWRVIGPRYRDGVVVLDDIASVDDLPAGVTDEQAPGRYRTTRTGGSALFDHVVGPHSAKNWVFPAHELVRSSTEAPLPDDRVALLGVRSCDLAAISRLDHVLDRRGVVDEAYVARRRHTLLIAVTCTRPAATCMCVAMGTGPVPGEGSDLTLTELTDPHRFVARAGSDAGARLLAAVTSRPVQPGDLTAEGAAVETARRAMSRTVPDDVPGLLRRASAPSLWSDVADRCLACGNCTLVCPTCFCTSADDVTDLVTGTSNRYRTWESCFSSQHSYANGGPVRTTVAARYRQWATHKLSSWWDQFGESGCVGCGRCVTWCPAGIDLFEELQHLHERVPAAEQEPSHA
jgi:sulfhydrogenase subunit beta (sulfur reductase)